MNSSLPQQIARAVALLLAVLAPIPFGATTPPVIAALALLTAIGLLALGWDRATLAPPRPLLRSLLLATALLPLIYLLPLPATVIEAVSPRLAQARLEAGTYAGAGILAQGDRELLAAGAPTASTGWAPLAIDPDGARFGAVRLWIYLAALLLALGTATTPFSRHLLAGALGLSAFLQASYGLAEALSHHHHILNRPKIHYLPLPSGTFVSPNHFAALLSLGLFSLLGLWVARQAQQDGDDPLTRWARRALAGTGVAIVAIALAWSSSRAALGCCAVGIGLFLLLRITVAARGETRFSATVGITALLGISAAGIAIALWARPPAPLATDVMHLESDWRGRSELWHAAWEAGAGFRMVGSGIGTYPALAPLTRPGSLPVVASHAHNDYIEWFAETGLLGAIWPALWLGVLTISSARLLRRGRDRTLTAAWLAALWALALHEGVDFSLQLAGVGVPAALLLGGLLAPEPWQVELVASQRSRGRWFAALPVTLAGALVIGALWLLIAPTTGWLRSPTAARQRARADVSELVAWAKRRNAIDPVQLRERAETAYALARAAAHAAPLQADAALTQWLAAQSLAAARSTSNDLPDSFLPFARALLERADKLDPSDRERRLTLARYWVAFGDREMALRQLRRFIGWSPQRAAEAYRVLGGDEVALGELMAATPSEPAAAVALASYLRQRRDLSGVGIVLARAYSQHREDVELRCAYAGLLRDRGERAEALALLSGIDWPSDRNQRRMVARLAAQIAATIPDAATFERAHAVLAATDVDRRVLDLERARLLYTEGRAAEAIALLVESRQAKRSVSWPADGTQLDSLLLLGTLQLKTGAVREALATYKEAQRLAPDNPNVREFFAKLGS